MPMYAEMESQPPHQEERLSNSQAIEHLKGALAQGKGWKHALLESMALWTLPEEVLQERHYKYLLDREAFDWPLLAERLLAEVAGLVPEEEKKDLLLSGDISLHFSEDELKRLLGPEKYSAYLNYWYGVVVEKSLIQCVELEERKRLRSGGLRTLAGVTERAYQRIYGLAREELLGKFCGERGYPPATAMTLTVAKEFTYWLFKYRMKHSEGARMASDTRKGILFFQDQYSRAREG
jgi:hypothetical protein